MPATYALIMNIETYDSLYFLSFLFQFGGVKEGDFIVSIGDRDVKWASHSEVVNLIKNAGDSLSLKLVTPMDKNNIKVNIFNMHL